MDDTVYMIMSIVLAVLLVISEILGTSKQTDSKSISALTANVAAQLVSKPESKPPVLELSPKVFEVIEV